jgi:hypothetical protein
MYHAWQRPEMHIKYWMENLKEGHCLEDLGVDGVDES